MSLVIQPQTFITDPSKSMQAKFYMKIITGLQNLKKACFIYRTKQKPFFFYQHNSLSVLKQEKSEHMF